MELRELINRVIRRILTKVGNTPQSRECIRELKDAIREYEKRWGSL